MAMSNLLKKIFPILFLSIVTSCAVVASPHGFGPGGFLFTDTTIGTGSGPVPYSEDLKIGSSCSYNILNFVSIGSGSIEKSALRNRISRIHSVDRSSFSILGGLLSYTCTNVKGREGEVPGSDDPFYRRRERSHKFREPEQAPESASSFNDTVILKDGTVFENVTVAVTRNAVVITRKDGTSMVYDKSRVKSLRKGR